MATAGTPAPTVAKSTSEPFYKMWQFWLAIIAALIQLPASFRHYRDWSQKGAVFSVTADLDNIDVPPAVKSDYALGSVVVLSIKNNGDRPAEDVTLRLQDSGHFLVKREDGQTQEGDFQNAVTIGRLKITEPITCRLWTSRRLDPKKDSIAITHLTGSQQVILPRKTTQPEFDWFTVSTFVFIVVVTVWTIERKTKRISELEKKVMELEKTKADLSSLLQSAVAEMNRQARADEARTAGS
jgi:hypothetical protein